MFAMVYIFMILSHHVVASFGNFQATRQRHYCKAFNAVSVWIVEAEPGFVDEDDNLEEGEECIRAVKAFASSSEGEERFLCAGALVKHKDSTIHTAWTADAILDNGGPNLQLQGALLVLDDMVYTHLQHERTMDTFVLHCGADPHSEFHCASYRAATLRGFVRLRSVVDSVNFQYDDLDAMVFDWKIGHQWYKQEALSSLTVAESILELPGDERVGLNAGDDSARRRDTGAIQDV